MQSLKFQRAFPIMTLLSWYLSHIFPFLSPLHFIFSSLFSSHSPYFPLLPFLFFPCISFLNPTSPTKHLPIKQNIIHFMIIKQFPITSLFYNYLAGPSFSFPSPKGLDDPAYSPRLMVAIVRKI